MGQVVKVQIELCWPDVFFLEALLAQVRKQIDDGVADDHLALYQFAKAGIGVGETVFRSFQNAHEAWGLFKQCTPPRIGKSKRILRLHLLCRLGADNEHAAYLMGR